MFDDRQTKEEIIAAASRQNEMLVEALCDVQRLTAALAEIRDLKLGVAWTQESRRMRDIARAALVDEQLTTDQK